MKKIAFFIVLYLISFNTGQAAQSTWETLVLAQVGSQWAIHAISPDSVQEIARIPNFPIETYRDPRAELSTDRTKLMIRDWWPYDPFPRYHIFDLTIGQPIPFTASYDATLPTPGEYITVSSVHISGFSPDATQLAVAWAGNTTTAPSLAPLGPNVGGVNILNLATGTFGPRLNLYEYPEFGGEMAFLGEWKADGLRLSPTAVCCHPATSGQYWRWNPATGEFVPTNEHWSASGDTLANTGQTTTAAWDEHFPWDRVSAAYENPINVIYAEGNTVYTSVIGLLATQPHWVMNGAAVLTVPQPHSTTTPLLIMRDGSTRLLPEIQSFHFISGTPDGWLMQSPNAYHHFTYHSGQLTSRRLNNDHLTISNLIPINTPPLGSPDLPPFPALASPFATPENWSALFLADGAVLRFSQTGSEEVFRLPSDLDLPPTPRVTWLPAQNRLLITSADAFTFSPSWLVDLNSGNVLPAVPPTIPLPPNSPYNLSPFSPDGRLLAVTAPNSSIFVFDGQTIIASVNQVQLAPFAPYEYAILRGWRGATLLFDMTCATACPDSSPLLELTWTPDGAGFVTPTDQPWQPSAILDGTGETLFLEHNQIFFSIDTTRLYAQPLATATHQFGLFPTWGRNGAAFLSTDGNELVIFYRNGDQTRLPMPPTWTITFAVGTPSGWLLGIQGGTSFSIVDFISSFSQMPTLFSGSSAAPIQTPLLGRSVTEPFTLPS